MEEDKEEKEDKEEDKGGLGEKKSDQEKPISPVIEMMGFEGHARVWLEETQGYFWDDDQQDQAALQSIGYKLRAVRQKAKQPTRKEDLLRDFQDLIENLEPWVREKKFSLSYIRDHFQELKNGQNKPDNASRNGYPIRSSSKVKTVFGDGGEL